MPETPDILLASHLRYKEVMCPCCEKAALHFRLLSAWEMLRAFCNSPIQIISGYRCPLRNTAVGGSARSQHMSGLALDLKCFSVDMAHDDLFTALLDFGFRGIGRWPNGTLHLDVRTVAAFWRYDHNGAWHHDPIGQEKYDEYVRGRAGRNF